MLKTTFGISLNCKNEEFTLIIKIIVYYNISKHSDTIDIFQDFEIFIINRIIITYLHNQMLKSQQNYKCTKYINNSYDI